MKNKKTYMKIIYHMILLFFFHIDNCIDIEFFIL